MDLRVDDHQTPVAILDSLVERNARYKTWRAAILTLAGREDEAARALAVLNKYAPEFVEVFRQLESTGLVDQSAAWKRVLPSA